MGIENVENVLERLGTTGSTTLAFKREDSGKIRVTSMLWEAPKVILRGDVLEIRTIERVCDNQVTGGTVVRHARIAGEP